jgi:hypothetical protein
VGIGNSQALNALGGRFKFPVHSPDSQLRACLGNVASCQGILALAVRTTPPATKLEDMYISVFSPARVSRVLSGLRLYLAFFREWVLVVCSTQCTMLISTGTFSILLSQMSFNPDLDSLLISSSDQQFFHLPLRSSLHVSPTATILPN